MKTIRVYRLRQQAEMAANYLMSRGIAANIRGFDIVPASLEKFHREGVELTVQDINFKRADELLKAREAAERNSPIESPL